MPLNRLLSFLILGLLLVAPSMGAAQTPDAKPVTQTAEQSIAHLADVLLIGEVVDVMRQEGLDYGAQMQEELFPRKGSATWQPKVKMIYDPAMMRARFDAEFQRQFIDDPKATTAILGFFETDLGHRILALEIEARRSLMDVAVEEAAKARIEEMEADGDHRITVLQQFAEVNDLVEMNVSGALNANLAFYQGMEEIGGLGEDMTEDQILSDVWAQEPDIRTETTEWLFPYLALAYGPLSDTELQAYIDFSQTLAGKKLNTALFASFDAVFTAISRDLGRAAARQMIGEDI